MSRKPMTVKQVREELSKQPDNAYFSWTDSVKGEVGYFYREDQDMMVDDGHVHMTLGGCEEQNRR